MALVLNGSANPIAGLAVGGLPDGSVDADTLASGAAVPADGSITTAKLADSAVTEPKRSDGSILQVVEGSTTTAVSSTSSDWYDTGLSGSITVKRTGSKIICLTSQSLQLGSNDRSIEFHHKVLRDSTDIWTTSADRTLYYYQNTDNSPTYIQPPPICKMVLDTHGASAGTTLTYKTQAKYTASESSAHGHWQGYQGGDESTIILMEVG